MCVGVFQARHADGEWAGQQSGVCSGSSSSPAADPRGST